MTEPLRIVDAGAVTALRSQALWHGIADAIRTGQHPVLSFCRSSEPYVCVGYHRHLDELDLTACKRLGLPVLRRQIGGGPVYVDSDQLLFQISLPVNAAPPGVQRLYARLLEPAATALRWLGVSAHLASTNDIVADGRKVSGTGAGQIGDGVVVVGNVMFAFPHERMASVLALPDEAMRSVCLDLMRSHVGALPQLNEESVKSALARAYSGALGRVAVRSELSELEHQSIEHWERQLSDLAWIAGPSLPAARGRQVKVRAGVWVYDGGLDRLRVRAVVEHDRVVSAEVSDAELNGSAQAISRALVGVSASRDALRAQLEEFGDEGLKVLEALEPGTGGALMAVVAGYELALDRHYDPDTNLWVQELGGGVVRIGYDPLGAETTGDIVAISFTPIGQRVARGEPLATVEAAKFVGPLPAPVSGVITAANVDVLGAPGAINADPLDTWLAELGDVDADDLERLLSGADEVTPWFEAAVERFRSEGAIAEP